MDSVHFYHVKKVPLSLVDHEPDTKRSIRYKDNFLIFIVKNPRLIARYLGRVETVSRDLDYDHKEAEKHFSLKKRIGISRCQTKFCDFV